MMSSNDVFEHEFLPLRAKLLEAAAALDRVDRSGGADDDPRMTRLREALAMLLQSEGARAEQLQMIFSRTYQEDWPAKLGLTL
jgi:hypothetical protein